MKSRNRLTYTAIASFWILTESIIAQAAIGSYSVHTLRIDGTHLGRSSHNYIYKNNFTFHKLPIRYMLLGASYPVRMRESFLVESAPCQISVTKYISGMHDEKERMQKDVSVACVKALSQHLSGGTWKIHDKL
jgi:hypothetical protein